MRIAFDIAQTGMIERAGCSWYAHGLACALAAMPEVELDAYPQFAEWLNVPGAVPDAVPCARMVMGNFTPEEARARWLDAAVAGLPDHPGIVHANSFQAPIVAGSRLVFTVHDLGFWSHPAYASEGTRLHCQRGTLDALERAAGFIFVSHAARAEFEAILPRWFEQTGRPWCVVPGASRFPPEAGHPIPAADAPWIAVGSIEPRKNHAVLLDAYDRYARAVPQPRRLRVIGGRGWKSEALHARFQAIASEGRIDYAGYLPEPELARAYRSAFALVQPSWHEGFGLPVVEAGAFGLPVIASAIPSLRETAGDAALFFVPSSAEALAAQMIRLHLDAALERDRSQASLHNGRRFDWGKSAATALEFYRSLVPEKLA